MERLREPEAGNESSLNLDDDNDDSTSPEVMSVRSESEPERKREVKMEKPKRFEGQKKLKLSVANALIMKARDDLDFKKRKWEEGLEEKRVLAKVSLMKVLSDMGMSQEDVLEQIKDL